MNPHIRALVRPIPDCYAAATAEHPVVIDIGLAVSQHQLYVDALTDLVDEVVWAPKLNESPDSVFVEDQVVVAEGRALMTRSGHPGRRVECRSVAKALSPHVDLHWMEAPACLDGGDVLRLGRHFFVGQSARSNPEGALRLEEVFGPLGYSVHCVNVSGVLHLKCACSGLRENLVVVVGNRVPVAVFSGVAEVVNVPEAEAYGANLLARGGDVIMAGGYPLTQRAVESHGFHVRTLNLSEIKKGDGALTCMSVWF